MRHRTLRGDTTPSPLAAAIVAGTALALFAGCADTGEASPPGPLPSHFTPRPPDDDAPVSGAFSSENTTTWQAPHMTNYGGPVMVSPTVYPVVWASDAESWGSFWSSYYSTTLGTGYLDWLSEYGVNRPAVGAPISVPSLDPSSPFVDIAESDPSCNAYDIGCKVGAELARLMGMGLVPWGDRDAYYPVLLGPSAHSQLCESGFWSGFSGYHNAVLVSGDAASGCGAAWPLGNPGFDEALGAPWSYQGQVSIVSPPGDGRVAQLCGAGGCSAYLAQTVAVPACDAAGINVWTQTIAGSGAGAHLEVRVLASGAALTAAPLATLISYSKLDGAPGSSGGGGGGWELRSLPLGAFAGQSVQIEIYAQTDAGDTTAFYVDDFSSGSLLAYGNIASYLPILGANGQPIVVNGVTECQPVPVAQMEPVVSHELIEATTDPTGPNTGFWDISARCGYLDLAPGPGVGPQEVADMCEYDWWNGVTLADGLGVSFGWSNAHGDCRMTCATPSPLLPSGNFESGGSGWTQSPAGIIRTTPSGYAHSGSGYALLGALEAVQSLTTPAITLPPAGCRTPETSFWLKVTPPANAAGNLDYLHVIVNDVTNPSSPTSTTTATFSGTDVSASGYVQYWIDLGGFEGRTVELEFQADETAGTRLTTFALDDIVVR